MKTLRSLALVTGILLPVAGCSSKDTLLQIRDATVDQPAQDAPNSGGSGAGGTSGTGGSGGAAASSGADASAASGGDAMACFSLFHACANDTDCCAPNRCINITGTLTCGREGPALGGSTATGGAGSGGSAVETGGMGAGGATGARDGGLDASDVPEAIVDAHTTITLDRTGCYGSCPSYSIRMGGDGTVTYVGRQFVKVVGTASSQVPVPDVQELVNEMEQANYFNLTVPDTCALGIETDAPTATTSLTLAGATHTVVHYYGNPCAPAVLTTIEDRIDAVANSAQWVKCDTAGGSCTGTAGSGGSDGAAGTGGGGATGGTSGTGGASSTGVSQATLLADGQSNPNAIAVDQSNVYWFNLGVSDNLGGKSVTPYTGGQLMKCSKSGCGQAPTVLASNRVQSVGALGPLGIGPMGLATDSVNVYWGDLTSSMPAAPYGGLFKCSVDGCNDNPLAIGSYGDEALAVHGTNIYWTMLEALVNTCPISGCGSAPTALWSAGNMPMATGIAVDSSGVYWATVGPVQIMKCPASGCGNAPTVLMVGTRDWNAVNIYNLAVDDNFVYVTNTNANGLVLACAKTGCADQPLVLVSGASAPSAIATDGVNVYWIEQVVVRRCAVGGCNNTPTTIWSGVTTLNAIALDDDNVYWTDTGSGSGDGRIWMAPK